jgi:pimeloyl-ACP methyl ester carboxylesterase
MSTVSSKDGTPIAYERRGAGPPVLLVDGAFCYRGFGPMPKLADALAAKHTVVLFDRRGRGESGAGSGPYAVEREIEDLEALLDLIGEPTHVYGVSSGAALALRATARLGDRVRRLVVYEPPFALDGTHHPVPADFREQIAERLRAGDRDSAVKLFMRAVGVPGFAIGMMRWMWWVWPKLRRVAHTLPHDFATLGETQSGGPLPDELRAVLAAIRVPTLALAGGKSPPWMHHGVKTVASTVPGARFDVVPGSDHNVAAAAVAPLLLHAFAS